MYKAVTISILLTLTISVSAQNMDDFSLINVVDNQNFTFSKAVSGQGAVIIFINEECPYSKFYIGRIQDLLSEYNDENIPFILINSDLQVNDQLKKETMKNFARQHNLSIYLNDPNGVVAKALGARKNPQAFVIQNLGDSFSVVYDGAIDDNPQNARDVNNNYLKTAIMLLIDGKSIPERMSPPVGCRIKS